MEHTADEEFGVLVEVRIESVDWEAGTLSAVAVTVGQAGGEAREAQPFVWPFLGPYEEPSVYSPVAAALDAEYPSVLEVGKDCQHSEAERGTGSPCEACATEWGLTLTPEQRTAFGRSYTAQEIFLGDVAWRLEEAVRDAKEAFERSLKSQSIK